MPLNIENDDAAVKTEELKKKPTKKTKEMLEENSKQIEELEASQKELGEELAALLKEEEALGDKSALKMKVTHKKYGEGVGEEIKELNSIATKELGGSSQ